MEGEGRGGGGVSIWGEPSPNGISRRIAGVRGQVQPHGTTQGSRTGGGPWSHGGGGGSSPLPDTGSLPRHGDEGPGPQAG